ncbi:phosphate ABC transporter permease PstA [Nocardioides yefusunii]|uniref:Phosphate transport system permease protein PstA n=1 Tax=Nocardioides yefusunii TaxID=2500546 RepID=A0ABW1R247_9ACTN|nr:phosphate ABC transporter permease PstA [Nocardioides yefusunii]
MSTTLPPSRPETVTALTAVATPQREVLRRTDGRTSEDRFALLGSLAASLALTWLLGTKIFAVSGGVAFTGLWYLVLLTVYAAVSALTQPRHVVKDRLASTAVVGAPLLVGLALLSTVVVTVMHGLPALTHLNFYTHDMAGVRPDDPFTRGGILHALVGTLIEVGIAVAIAMPLGVAAAVYICEVGGRGARLVRMVVEAMTALPSIVAGLFVYTVCLVHLGMPASGLSAALALAVMALPIMARASCVIFSVVPGGLREASYALGATRWQTVRKVVLPTARAGLATALILGMARAIGETAPVLLTSGASTYFNANPLDEPMNSLPLYIYAAVTSGSPQMEQRAYAAAAVLLVVVLLMFVIARLVAGGRKSR